MEFGQFATIVLFFLATAGTFLLKIHDLATEIRTDIIDYNITNDGNTITTIRMIEQNENSRWAVHIYYEETLRLTGWFRNGFIVIVFLAIIMIMPEQLGRLSCISDTATSVIKYSIIALSVIWCLLVIIRYSKGSRVRGSYQPRL